MASRVVRATNLPPRAQEADVLEAFTQYGPVSYVLIEEPGIAMVEFENVQAARMCSQAAMSNGIFINNQPLYLSPSQVAAIPRQSKLESTTPTNCLIMFVANPQKQITPKIVKTICSRVGQPVRIAVHQEDRTFALVEFGDVETARSIKHALNGCDIFSGCCTLKIDFANLQKVKTTPGDPNCMDITGGAEDPSRFGVPASTMQARPGLLGDDSMGGGGHGGAGMGGMTNGGRGAFANGASRGRGAFGSMGNGMGPGAGPRGGMMGGGGPRMQMGGGGGMGGMGPGMGGGMGGPGGMGGMAPGMFPPGPGGMGGMGGPGMPGNGYDDENGATVMIFNLNSDRVNADKLFNLFCLYGNVVKVLFMKGKPENAMLQFSDAMSAQRAIQHLNGFDLFGKRLKMQLSNRGNIKNIPKPVELEDGTPSFKDFSDSRLNRFTNPKQSAMNRIVFPHKSLYFFNVPPGTDEENVSKIFTDADCTAPVKVSFFKKEADGKPLSGFAEFSDESEAMDALTATNNTTMENPDPKGKFPFCVKLTFFSSNNDQGGGRGGMRGGGVMGGGPGGMMGFGMGMPPGMRGRGGMRGGRGGRGGGVMDGRIEKRGGGMGMMRGRGGPRGRGRGGFAMGM